VATPFEDVYDLFLVEIQDWKLDNLYDTSLSDFEIYLQGFMISAIPEFTNCAQDLSYTLTATPTFNSTLTLTEQKIMAKLMVLEWMQKKINNVNQFELHLNDNDFKHFSEAQNLNGKLNMRNMFREIVDRDMTIYGIKSNTDWDSWRAGVYDPDM